MKCGKEPQTCRKCGRIGHIAKYCRCLGADDDDEEVAGSEESDEKPTKPEKGKKGVSAYATSIQDAWDQEFNWGGYHADDFTEAV